MNTNPANQPEPQTGSFPDEPQPELQGENSITYPPSEMELEPHVSLLAGAITCALFNKLTPELGAQEARDFAESVLNEMSIINAELRRHGDYTGNEWHSLSAALFQWLWNLPPHRFIGPSRLLKNHLVSC